ncbi:MAG: hypothetical protein AB1816_16135 [Bacillota bacterium]
MKAILPARSRAAPRPRHSRMPDRCPRCWQPCLPVGWTVEGISVKAVYVCPRCGNAWPCWWHRERVGL